MVDVIIIGAGPAGVSAALYAQSRGMTILLFEKEEIGGLIAKVSKVSHYAAAVVDETGKQFQQRLQQQLASYGITPVYEEVLSLSKARDNSVVSSDATSAAATEFVVRTAQGEYHAHQVIVATGSAPKQLNIDSTGHAIAHWTAGFEQAVRDKIVIINGGSDGAAKEALHLLDFAREIHIVQAAPRLLCIAEFKRQLEASDKVIVHCGTTLTEIQTEGERITKAQLSDGSTIVSDVSTKSGIDVDVKQAAGIEIFTMIGQTPNSNFIDPALALPRNDQGFIDSDVVSAVKGLYVAGDVRAKAVRQVATAVNDGCLAGVAAAKHCLQ